MNTPARTRPPALSSLLALGLAALLAGCGGTPVPGSPLGRTSASLGPGGGSLGLPSGALAAFDPGALGATTEARLETYGEPAAALEPGLRALGPRATLSFPTSTLGVDPAARIYVGLPGPGTTAETAAELRLERPQRDLALLDYYDPESENVVSVSVAQLRRWLGPNPPARVELSVQPLDVSGYLGNARGASARVRPQWIFGTVTTGLYRFSAAYDPTRDFEASCSGEESLPASMPRAAAGDLPAGKTPLVLVHGWQVLTEAGEFKSNYAPLLCDWGPTSAAILADPALGGFALYSFGYDSRLGVAGNAALLGTALSATFGDREVVLLAHSMGGLLAHALAQTNAKLRPLTLGTPYRGSALLVCTQASFDGTRCDEARPQPTIWEELKEEIGSTLMDVVDAAMPLITAWQGTEDLTWQFGGLSGGVRRRVCDEKICETRVVSVDNPYLRGLNAAPPPGGYGRYAAAYGLIEPPQNPDFSLLGIVLSGMAEALLGATGRASDGAVSADSACLSTAASATGVDNACAAASIPSPLRREGLEHTALKNDYPTVKALLLPLAPGRAGGKDDKEVQ